MIELYYTNTNGNTVFTKNTSDSRGGAITTTKISGGVNNLFGTVSQKDIDYGKTDYRCIGLKNTSSSKDIQDIKIWIEQAITKDFYSYNVVFIQPNQNSSLNAKFGNITGWDFTRYPIIYLKYYANSCTIFKSQYDRANNINAIAFFETSIGNNTVIEQNSSGWSGLVTIDSISFENNECFEVLKNKVSDSFNPINLDPSPTNNDSCIIPKLATGEWTGYDGYIATWNGYKWDIEIDDFESFEFGIEKLENGLVQSLNDIFQQPYGIDFVPAKSLQNAFNIQLIEKNSSLALWIKRDIKKRNIIEKDFIKLDVQTNNPIVFNQEFSLFCDFIEMNSFKVTYNKDSKFVKDTLLSLDFAVKVLEIGEANYTNLSIAIRTKYLAGFDPTKVDFKASFMSTVYNNVTLLDSFADFQTTNNFNQNLNLLGHFKESGIYELFFDLIDLTDNHVVNTNSFLFTILDE